VSLSSALEQALAAVLRLEIPADRALSEFFRRNPSLGRRDRGMIAETVFDVLRNRRLYEHLAQNVPGRPGGLERRLALLSPVAAGLARTAEQRAWVADAASVPRGELAPALRLSLPDWLADRLQAAFPGDEFEELAAALLRPAPLDLRVNLARASRDAVQAALRDDGIESEPLALTDTALRVRGKPALERSPPFVRGEVEVQDAGSQLLTQLVAPRRGQTVVDFCAGAGGKTLALAAAMRSTGQIFACDVSAVRLRRMKPRLARSGATNVQPFGIDSEDDPKLTRLAERADAVLVDAPCSGTGTLRRNPDLKWRLSERDVARLVDTQYAILGAAARLVKKGGVLVYSTCSLLPEENEGVAARFEAAHPGFVRDDPRRHVAEETCVDDALRLLAHRHDTDCFFAVRWTRRER